MEHDKQQLPWKRGWINTEGYNTPTPPRLALGLLRYLIRHYGPFESYCDPAAGEGAWHRWMPEPKTWFERQRGRNFLDYCGPRFGLIATNGPWDDQATDFLSKCFESAENVALLLTIGAAIGTRKRVLIAVEMGFKERLRINFSAYGRGGQMTMGGMQIGLVYWARGYKGDCKIVDWNSRPLDRVRKPQWNIAS